MRFMRGSFYSPPRRGGEYELRRRWRRLQCHDRSRVPRTHRPRKFFLRTIIVVLDEFPGQIRSLLRIDSKHSELNELVGLNLACPGRPDDLAFIIFFEIDLPAGFELEII